ncbi:AhpC/TSA family protein [Inquilinus sp. KBS0705]|nr:AhpC/TSA family protein [Inquilinus sp. KBS0705]
MKRINFFLLLFCTVLKVNAQNFTFSGKIDSTEGMSARLTYFNDKGVYTIDSCALENGNFSFKGLVNGVSNAFLIVYKAPYIAKDIHQSDYAHFLLEAGVITGTAVNGHINGLKVTGSKSQNESLALHAQINEANKGLADVMKSYGAVALEIEAAKKANKGDKKIDSLNETLTAILRQREPFVKKYEEIISKFIATHPNSYISAIEMSPYTSTWPVDSLQVIFDRFSPAVKKSTPGLGVQKAISTRLAANIINNVKAENFTAYDVNGKSVSLANFKGKYVLLDFWGSWCVPCRESTPHLILLFNKYHRAGLDVIAIAANDKPDDWRRAIKKDNTGIWYNVLDKDKPNSLTETYSVNLFPTKILIDNEGTIIGRYDGTQAANALDSKLAEIFGVK